MQTAPQQILLGRFACLVAGDDGAQDCGWTGAGRVRQCVVLVVGGLAGQSCLGADVGEQVVGEQLCEGFGELNVLDAAVAV
ncbi:MAG: hypothetical protein ACRDSZ_08540 [Pseudonocardiaceae bacterium]